ncbi:hypothetical protein L1049_002990 [Liquidambar formosana]|uniref:CRM domain-containing protein n=1 Tax=Liquidambar formosana TaxID=63359 RepID=A0AAP0NJ80_LIQFO
MFAVRNLQRRCLKSLFPFIHTNPSKDVFPKLISSNVIQSRFREEDNSFPSCKPWNCLDGSRAMSTARGRSMRSKVESRMRKESGKTLREIRRAKKLRKKLMTEEERLIYNLRRAKKKVALLLQKLKKYELPELPPPRHDPELLTSEHLQAFKKIGFRNKNYVPVGVRGVFGGVVQNMHLHWKFHETVQVCCDNFPKEKIKEMATMLARLSGGIVINIHNVKTIIMFRGRNYRQPKNLIPINTLTKRKALFKARFEQALDSQKLNIKKLEQQLRRMGVNPEDPVAMASIQRVASTFFNAIDKKEGTPYVFHGDKQSAGRPNDNLELSEPPDDSDQEDLDRFIAEIEDAADKEWAAEEAAEKEEIGKMRYWNREDFDGRFRRSEMHGNEDSDDEIRGARDWKDTRGRQQTMDSDDEDDDVSRGNNEWDSNHAGDMSDLESDANDSNEAHDEFENSRVGRGKKDKISRANNNEGFKRNAEVKFKGKMAEEDSESEDMLSDLEDAMWKSDDEEEHNLRTSKAKNDDYRSSSDDEGELYLIKKDKKNMLHQANIHERDGDDSDVAHDDFKLSRLSKGKKGGIGKVNNNEGFRRNAEANFRGEMTEEDSGPEGILSGSEWESNAEEDLRPSRMASYDYRGSGDEEDYHMKKDEKNSENGKKMKTPKQVDETWDSD